MGKVASDLRGGLLRWDDVADLFGQMVVDLAASGAVDNQQDSYFWQGLVAGSQSPVTQGRVTGCEVTWGRPDDGLQTFSAGEGIFSVSTRLSRYESSDAAARAFAAMMRQLGASPGPLGRYGISAYTATRLPSSDQHGAFQRARFNLGFASPSGPEPYPRTLGLSIPPRTWEEHWSILLC